MEKLGEGDYEAHLPLFDESFFYYDPKQFRSLVHLFCNGFTQWSKSSCLVSAFDVQHSEIRAFVTLRVNYDREFSRNRNNLQPTFETLSRLTVQYPFSKALKKNINAGPDAAWELENKVAEVVDKLINSRSNLLIVGNHGVGKSAVLMQAIRKIQQPIEKTECQQYFLANNATADHRECKISR